MRCGGSPNSILLNDGGLAANKTIKSKSETSVLKLKVADEIELSAVEFARLAEAFFAEMKAKFVSPGFPSCQ
jgi:hypothetical protein